MRRPSPDMVYTKVLGKIIEISHANIELSSKINAILEIISKQLNFEEVMLFTVRSDKRLYLEFKSKESKLYHLLEDYKCYVGEGVIGSVAQKRSPEIYTFRTVPSRFGCLFYKGLDDVLQRYKLFSFFPVCDDCFLYGVLLLCSSKKINMGNEERIFLSVVCREIGGIIRFHDLILSSKKRISELATLSEIGRTLFLNLDSKEVIRRLLLTISKVLDSPFASIYIRGLPFKDEERFIYGEIPSDLEKELPLLEKEAIEKKNQISIKSPSLFLLSTPLLSKEGVYGAISVVGEEGREEEHRYMLSMIGRYVANGLENLFLSEKLKDVIAELKEAERTLIEQEKFKGLGQMVAYLAHEIKTPLAAIGGFARRLEKALRSNQEKKEYINIIIKEVERLENTLKDILSYVRDVPLCYELCDINRHLNETLELLLADPLWSGIMIEKSCDEDIPPLLCDSKQVRQVFLNIIVNAFEAMKGKGTLKIKTEKRVIRDREYAAIVIEDTGGGIDPSIIGNIFNPFFTTKADGTGLGLSISNKIILNHGGRIDVENKPGIGAKFTVYLPLKLNE